MNDIAERLARKQTKNETDIDFLMYQLEKYSTMKMSKDFLESLETLRIPKSSVIFTEGTLIDDFSYLVLKGSILILTKKQNCLDRKKFFDSLMTQFHVNNPSQQYISQNLSNPESLQASPLKIVNTAQKSQMISQQEPLITPQLKPLATPPNKSQIASDLEPQIIHQLESHNIQNQQFDSSQFNLNQNPLIVNNQKIIFQSKQNETNSTEFMGDIQKTQIHNNQNDNNQIHLISDYQRDLQNSNSNDSIQNYDSLQKQQEQNSKVNNTYSNESIDIIQNNQTIAEQFQNVQPPLTTSIPLFSNPIPQNTLPQLSSNFVEEFKREFPNGLEQYGKIYGSVNEGNLFGEESIYNPQLLKKKFYSYTAIASSDSIVAIVNSSLVNHILSKIDEKFSNRVLKFQNFMSTQQKPLIQKNINPNQVQTCKSSPNNFLQETQKSTLTSLRMSSPPRYKKQQFEQIDPGYQRQDIFYEKMLQNNKIRKKYESEQSSNSSQQRNIKYDGQLWSPKFSSCKGDKNTIIQTKVVITNVLHTKGQLDNSKLYQDSAKFHLNNTKQYQDNSKYQLENQKFHQESQKQFQDISKYQLYSQKQNIESQKLQQGISLQSLKKYFPHEKVIKQVEYQQRINRSQSPPCSRQESKRRLQMLLYQNIQPQFDEMVPINNYEAIQNQENEIFERKNRSHSPLINTNYRLQQLQEISKNGGEGQYQTLYQQQQIQQQQDNKMNQKEKVDFVRKIQVTKNQNYIIRDKKSIKYLYQKEVEQDKTISYSNFLLNNQTSRSLEKNNVTCLVVSASSIKKI